MTDALVGIGRFIALRGQTQDGEAFSLYPERGQSLWLAWRGDPERGDLIIVNQQGRRTRHATGHEATARLHRTFHDAEPDGWRDVEWTPPTKAVERLGFARAIVYRIPSRMPSNKQGSDWIHSFGDFGGGVDEREDARRWPAVARGPDGSIYLLRRSHTAYRLDDWLVG